MLKNVKILNLSGNFIEDIKKIELFSLEFINLEKNQIKSLNFLENSVNLKEIHIAENRIKTVANLMKLKELIFLDISDNLIENFDALGMLSFNVKLKFVNLSGNSLEKKSNFKNNVKKLLSGVFFENLDSKFSCFFSFRKIAFNLKENFERIREKSLNLNKKKAFVLAGKIKEEYSSITYREESEFEKKKEAFLVNLRRKIL